MNRKESMGYSPIRPRKWLFSNLGVDSRCDLKDGFRTIVAGNHRTVQRPACCTSTSSQCRTWREGGVLPVGAAGQAVSTGDPPQEVVELVGDPGRGLATGDAILPLLAAAGGDSVAAGLLAAVHQPVGARDELPDGVTRVGERRADRHRDRGVAAVDGQA